MDVPTVIRKTRRLFGDDNSIVFTDADVMDWINEAQFQIARETKCLSANSSNAASAFPVTYPSDFIKISRIIYGTRSLEETSVDDLDAKDFDRTYNGVPEFYYYVNGQVCLWPDPASTDTTTVSFNYVKSPAQVTSTADPLEVPHYLHEDIVAHCVMRAHERNENYRAVELKQVEYSNSRAQRLDDVYDQADAYETKRDDPGYFW